MYLIKDNKYKDACLCECIKEKEDSFYAKNGRIIVGGFLRRGFIYNDNNFDYFGLIKDCVVIEFNQKIAEILYA